MAKILLVEDDVHMLRVTSMWLARNSHEVVEACNGAVAQELLSEQTFDLIVSDVNMPKLDGISLVRWLRSAHGSQTPVILLSSRSDQLLIAKEMEPLGVKIHPKPFSPSRLVADIERRLDAEEAGGCQPSALGDQLGDAAG